MCSVVNDGHLGTDLRAQLLDRIESKTVRAAVIGLGYVGLPLAVTLAEAGYTVTGLDVDPVKVESVCNGVSYLPDVPTEAVTRLMLAGRLRASTDFSLLADCDAISICVPTPLRKTREPDVSYVVSAAESIREHLRPGTLVLLESTTYPGTTREVILPRLQNERVGLTVGESFFLAFSPERVDPGRRDWTTWNTPKVIGGVTPTCLEVASAYYAQAIHRVVPVSSADAAEMVKLLENTFRSINIGLANETLLMCDQLGLDAWEVIEAAATKPFGFMKFTPRPGLGGHCIPIDPLYLSWRLKGQQYTARFIELASEINAEMPAYWVHKVQDALNEAGKPVKGSKILLLGVAYKANVEDTRESPALDIALLLTEKGARVSYHDPYVPSIDEEGMVMTSVPDLEAALSDSDCVVVATDHDDYDWRLIADTTHLVVDTRHVLQSEPPAPTVEPSASSVVAIAGGVSS
jgi:UDP-N-acetyl-D-glucosamine dehydrogenase